MYGCLIVFFTFIHESNLHVRNQYLILERDGYLLPTTVVENNLLWSKSLACYRPTPQHFGKIECKVNSDFFIDFAMAGFIDFGFGRCEVKV